MELEEYQRIKSIVKSHIGIDLEHYKDEQMRRRLDSWLIRSGLRTWEDYFAKIKVDKDELLKFRNYLTINVTEFFRDTERWKYLQTNILPMLIRESPQRPGMRIWSAGCSIGAEPFTLAMILEELTPTRKHHILGTDLDKGAIARASSGGGFIQEEIRGLSSKQRETYFKPGGPPFFVVDSLIKKITFREQNMISDTFDTDFDLIVCRNVVIYFTSTTKELLYKKFAASLRKGGILFIGGTEIIPHPQDYGLKSIGISFYQKL
ncbi:MAG: protein-glutamate O-methyltransferase CheR [Leptolinea sp.]|nr:protein-glutamate O-methyltransferase CheR [Leptolinea sp.]